MSDSNRVPRLKDLEEIADETIKLAEQIKVIVAEMRRRDTRGENDGDSAQR